jgi:hypothetical protein
MRCSIYGIHKWRRLPTAGPFRKDTRRKSPQWRRQPAAGLRQLGVARGMHDGEHTPRSGRRSAAAHSTPFWATRVSLAGPVARNPPGSTYILSGPKKCAVRSGWRPSRTTRAAGKELRELEDSLLSGSDGYNRLLCDIILHANFFVPIHPREEPANCWDKQRKG